MKKTISILLSAVLLLSMLSIGAYAAPSLTIVTQPTEASIVNGEDAYFYVEVTGGSGEYLYQWYYDFGTALMDGDGFMGTDTDWLTVVSTWARGGDTDCTWDGDRFYCKITDANNPSLYVFSDTARYTVTDHPIRFNDTEHWCFCECDDMIGFDGSHIDNGYGVCTECEAYFDPAFSITQQPVDVTIISGKNATFTVRTNKPGLTYQWCYMYEEEQTPNLNGSDAIEDGNYWAGTQTNTLTVKSTNNLGTDENDAMYDGERYYCLISDQYGTIVSRVATYNVHPFKDVTNKSAWYYEGVKEAAICGLFSGDTQGRFNPTNSITRAESVVVLTRMLGFEGIDELSTQEFNEVLKEISRRLGTPLVSFKDVKASDWYGREALILAQMGFVSGVGGGNFGGSRLITRQEIAALIYRISMFIEENEGDELYFGSPSISRYTDMNKVASWAKTSVEWARASGLFSGDDKGRFNPNNNCTRAEFALVATRFYYAY